MVPDVLGYLLLCGLPVPRDVSVAARMMRYHRRVFIAPPWPEIFAQDNERRQDLDEAERTHRTMLDTYSRLGYELVTLPQVDVGRRGDFVSAHIDR